MKTLLSCSTALLGIFLISSRPSTAADIGAPFPIAATAGVELALGTGAFDGTNFLVCITGDAASPSNITARFVSPAGSLVGPLVHLGGTGGWCSVAFDGTNYLVVWPTASAVTGRFVSTSGALVGSPFTIATGSVEGATLLFDGSNYFVEWQAGNDLFGQFITKSGAKLGSVIDVSQGTAGLTGTTLAFDGANILAVWVDGRRLNELTDLYGQFITKSSGVAAGALLGSNFLINASDAVRDQTWPAVAFNGTDYLVVITEPTVSPEGRMYVVGQMVDKAGANVGGEIILDTGGTEDKFAPFVASDGDGFLVTWADMRNDANRDGVCDVGEGTCWDLGGQFIDGAGALAGTDFVISSAPENQVGGALYAAGRFLLVVNTVHNLFGGGDGDVFGMILTPPSLSLSVNDVSVTEGNSGTTTATFTVSLSAVSAQTVTVAYATANGTATAGADYVAASGTLTFPPGTTTQPVSVTVNGDTTNEPNDTFFVNLSAATNATIADSQGLGTITNDDPLPSLTISDVSVAEGDAGTTMATFTVGLSAVSAQTVTVHYTTADGTATAGSDYITTFGPLTIPAGSLSQTISISVNGDVAYEPDETFFLNLSTPTNATLADAQGVGTITNDDSPPTLSIGDVSVPRGPSGTTSAAFPVTLSAASYQSVTVAYATADGTATGGVDYVLTTGGLTLPPGVTSANVNVTVNGMPGPSGKTFFVDLSSPVHAAIADGRGEATLVAVDHGFYTVTPCRAIDTRNPAPGTPLAAGAPRTFVVTGSCGIPPTAHAVSLNITVTDATGNGNVRLYAGGTATPGVSTINFAAGLTRANNALTPLGANGDISALLSPAGTVHVIIDVNGYFE